MTCTIYISNTKSIFKRVEITDTFVFFRHYISVTFCLLALVFLENYIDFFIKTAYNISEQSNLLDLSALLL